MRNLLFLFLIIGVNSILNVNKKIISKISWGVNFKYLKTIRVDSEKYMVTFPYRIPYIEQKAIDTRTEAVECTTQAQIMAGCEILNNISSYAINSINEVAVSVQERINIALTAIPNIDVETVTEEQIRTRLELYTPSGYGEKKLRRRKRDTFEKPDACKKYESGDVKSGSGNIFGKFVSSLTDQPDWDDIKAIDKNICQLSDFTQMVDGEIVKTQNEFNSRMNIFDNRVDKLTDTVIALHEDIVDMNNRLSEIVQQDTEHLNEIELQLNYTKNAVYSLMRMISKINLFNLHLYNSVKLADEFVTGVRTLSEGRLPKEIIPFKYIKTIIEHIKNEISTKEYSLSNTLPQYYYTAKLVTYGYSAKKGLLFVLVPFHLKTPSSEMALYSLTKLPIPIDKYKNKTTILSNDVSPFIAISSDSKYSIDISTQELISCTSLTFGSDSDALCKMSKAPILTISDGASCAASIFIDNKYGIKKSCNYIYDDVINQVGFVQRITDDHYYIFRPEVPPLKKDIPDDYRWNLYCPMYPGKENTAIIPEINAIIRCPCGCGVYHKDEPIIPELYTACKSIGSATATSPHPTIEKSYPIHLPSLIYDYDIEELDDAYGNNIYKTDWDYTLPNLTIENNQFEQSVEYDHIQSNNLKRYLEISENDTLAFKTKADQILHDVRKDLDANKPYISDAVNSLSKWLNRLGGIGGTVALQIAACAIPTIFFFLICCGKI